MAAPRPRPIIHAALEIVDGTRASVVFVPTVQPDAEQLLDPEHERIGETVTVENLTQSLLRDAEPMRRLFLGPRGGVDGTDEVCAPGLPSHVQWHDDHPLIMPRVSKRSKKFLDCEVRLRYGEDCRGAKRL